MADDDKKVRIWSTVGVTLPIPDTYANVKFSFGHERFSKSDSIRDLELAEAKMHEFNARILNTRLEEHERVVRAYLKPKKKGKKK